MTTKNRLKNGKLHILCFICPSGRHCLTLIFSIYTILPLKHDVEAVTNTINEIINKIRCSCVGDL